MKHPRTGFLSQFTRFGAVGVANTLIGSGLVLALTWYGLDPFVSNICGYAVGTAFSYVANSRWTFGARMSGHGLLRFLLVIGAAFGLNMLVLALFLRWGWGGLASQLPAMVTFTVANFLGQRYFTFRHKRSEG